MPRKTSLYHQLLDLAYNLSQTVHKGKVNIDTTNGAMYTNETTDVDDYYLRTAVAIVDLTVFDGLSAHACKYLIGIMKEMKMNNVFFVAPDVTTANIRRSIAELKRHQILYPTERAKLFIINPFKIRRGKPMATIMASLHHYHKDNSVFKLQDLRPPKQAMLA